MAPIIVPDNRFMRGLTFSSIPLSILGLILMALTCQFLGVFGAGAGASFGTEALPLQALLIFCLLAGLGTILFRAVGLRFLQPAEAFCILYILLLAAPLMTTGFWRFMLASASTVVRQSDWEHYDCLSPRLWPHGADLIPDFNSASLKSAAVVSGSVGWERLSVRTARDFRDVPVLVNTTNDGSSSISFRLPVTGKNALALNQPYMLSMLARADDLGPQAHYYVRLTYDDHPAYDVELFRSDDAKAVTYLQPGGFNRHGSYGFVLPDKVRNVVTVEAGLTGQGRLAIGDLDMYCVAALENAYTGLRLASAQDASNVPPGSGGNLVVKPASWWSPSGLIFLFDGYVPWSQWSGPIFFWGGYVSLLLAATFAFACLLRRQWIESERFALPMTHVPITLAGLEPLLRGGSSYLRNPSLWLGGALMFFFVVCNELHPILAVFPDFSINVPLKSYLPDPGWGKMWEISFTFSGLYFALGLFMELNVLFSLVAGFFLFRFQYFIGETQGLTADDAYPYVGEQTTGALLLYGLLVLFVARRFLCRTFVEAWRGDQSSETLTPRAALGLLAGALVGIALLALWADLGIWGTLLLSVCILLILLCGMKMRAETGYPAATFFQFPNASQPLFFLFTLFGSVSCFAPATTVFWGLFTSIFLSQSCFCIVPGIQAEFVALGQRLHLQKRELILASVLGIGGGLAVGGWVYLTGAYVVGAENYPIVGQYGGLGSLGFLNSAVASSSDGLPHGLLSGWTDPQHLAFIFGAGVTTVLSTLRQLYAGFWFHPLGFVLGPSKMMDDAWGSILMAWAVRLAVLRLTGAAGVRERLYPFAVGCILAIVLACGLLASLNAYLYFYVPGAPKPLYQF